MLLIVVALLVASTAYLIITNKTTPVERDEMLNEKDWF
jgi:hypothetical protein